VVNARLVVASGRKAFSRPWVVISWLWVAIARLRVALPWAWVVVTRTRIVLARPWATQTPSAAVAVMLAPQSGKTLLLSVCVDVGPNDEADDVEEGHPCVLGQELLGKGERDGRHDPADLHDRPESSLDRGTHLVEGASTRDDGHGDQVDGVLDG
jgi:hypothetical protein